MYATLKGLETSCDISHAIPAYMHTCTQEKLRIYLDEGIFGNCLLSNTPFSSHWDC